MFNKIKNIFRSESVLDIHKQKELQLRNNLINDLITRSYEKCLEVVAKQNAKKEELYSDQEDTGEVSYKKRKKHWQTGAVLTDGQVQMLHKYYFDTDLKNRLEAIKKAKHVPHKPGTPTWVIERSIDGSVLDYIIGWAPVDHIAKRWEINIADVYRNVRFIANMVENAATK